MGFNCGIIGLPNSGKSTLFNALTRAHIPAEAHPFCTIEPNIGIVNVPDPRLDDLKKFFNPPKVIPTHIEFVDIAGLVKGASKGEGLGNQFLAKIREVDAIANVIRCFDHPNVAHYYETNDPIRDIEIINYELIFKDLETVDKAYRSSTTNIKSGDKKYKVEAEFLERLRNHLSEGKLSKDFLVRENEIEIFDKLFLLTSKPMMFIANVNEGDISADNDYILKIKDYAKKINSPVLKISAKIEDEIAELEKDEQIAFMNELDLKESGLSKIINGGYNLLDLITFFTHNEKEVRAWTVKKNTTSPKAAGKIHSDFEKGFIKADVIKYSDLLKYGSEHYLKEHGLVGIHGHDYLVQDGDIIFFKFHV